MSSQASAVKGDTIGGGTGVYCINLPCEQPIMESSETSCRTKINALDLNLNKQIINNSHMESDTAYTTPLKGSDLLRVQIHVVSEIAK